MKLLRKLLDFTGYHLHAKDGEIGKMKEIYFDDELWVVRYFVVRTGNWLMGKNVLITPSVVTRVDETNKRLEVNLTQVQIKNCPPVDTELPVARYYEEEFYKHYGLEFYWSGKSMLGAGSPYLPRPDIAEGSAEPDHPHLRSSNTVKGYKIQATNGEIGFVEDFIVDEVNWTIQYFEINTHKWIPTKTVLISPKWIDEINWKKEEVFLNMTREAVQLAPNYDTSKVISEAYQEKLNLHYLAMAKDYP